MPAVLKADSLGFLNLQMEDPISPNMPKGISVMGITAVAPLQGRWDFDTFLGELRRFRGKALSNQGVHLITSSRNILREGSTGLLLSSQHAPNGLTQESIKEMMSSGLRAMAITYNGGGEYVDKDGHLNEKGEKLIMWMNECGMMLDVSHASHQVALGALELLWNQRSFIPPMASHSGCFAVHPHERNLQDDILLQIRKMGGYVGIPAINFMTGGDDFLAFARHLQHAIDVCGSVCVGIGSDCPYLNLTLEQARAQYDRMLIALGGKVPKDVVHPDRPQVAIEHGRELLDHLAEVLKGFPDSVFGQNFVEYLRRSL